jgi:hypothetical protein
MSSHHSRTATRPLTRRSPMETELADGVQRFHMFICRGNNSHRVVLQQRYPHGAPEGHCPSCGAMLEYHLSFREGDPAPRGLNLDEAKESLRRDGYYCWELAG